jgi:hypothetical protein
MVDVNLILVGCDEDVRWMLRVLICENVAPGHNCERELKDSCVNGSTVSCIPNDEGVVLSKSREEALVRRKG